MLTAMPRDFVATLEAHPVVPEGAADRFAGYGVLGLTFESGDVLAARRCAASSIGPGYTSVWHRAPERPWTFFQDVGSMAGCSRYFASGADRVERASIRIVWTGATRLVVLVDEGTTLEWHMELADALVPDAISRLARAAPDRVWSRPRLMNPIAATCGGLLGVGRVRLAGRTPSAFDFRARPSGLWRIADSRAVIRGRHLGAPVTARVQPRLGDLWIPRRGLFVVAQTYLSPRAPQRT